MKITSPVLFLFILSTAEDHQVDANDVQGVVRDTLLTRVLRHFIELFRHGLIDAKVENWAVPNVDWKIDNKNFFGVVHIQDVKVIGLTGFHVKNISGSLTKMRLELDIEAPLVEITGNYDMEGKVFGIPVSGNGIYSLKLSKVEVRGGSKLKTRNFGTAASIEILNPMVNVKGMGLSFDGPLDSLSLTKLILIGWSALVMYSAVLVVVTLFSKRITTRLRRRQARLKSFNPLK